MPDAHFSDPRLARLHDALDPDRSDLAAYVALVGELAARRVLDIGCGTGTLALLLAECGLEVTGVDPALASLDVSRSKPRAGLVTWLHGTVTDLPAMQVDLALMTGNVAQVFLTDEHWTATLDGVRAAVAPGGHLVFETRVPSGQAWLDWTPEPSRTRADAPGSAVVECWVEITDVSPGLVGFRWTYRFDADGAVLVSDSTLRFRERDELVASLEHAGSTVRDVRAAPDRPGQEMVFVARRPEGR